MHLSIEEDQSKSVQRFETLKPRPRVDRLTVPARLIKHFSFYLYPFTIQNLSVCLSVCLSVYQCICLCVRIFLDTYDTDFDET